MKKFLVSLLVLLMVFSMFSCTSKKEKNEIADLYSEGFTPTMTSYDDTVWNGLFENLETRDKAYKVKVNLSSSEHKALSKISFSDDDSDSKFQKVLEYVVDYEITDISDLLPNEETFKDLIGLTFKDLEDLGYERTGYLGDIDYKFFFDGPLYAILVKGPEGLDINLDDYSENDLRELVVTSVEFNSFAQGILE